MRSARRTNPASRKAPLTFSRSKFNALVTGAPLVILLVWVAKVWSPDLNTKAGLMARDLEARLQLVSSGAALWQQLLLPLFTVACAIYIMRSKTLMLRYFYVLMPLLMLAAFLFLSFLWSDHPDDTLRRAARQFFLFTSVAGAVVITRSGGYFVAAMQAATVFVLIAESSFLLVPHISFDTYGNFTGLHSSKNEFGGIAGAFLLVAIATLRYYVDTPKERLLAIVSIVGWSGLLVISGSKTPIGLVVFFLPFLLIHHKYLRVLALGILAAWFAVIVFIPLFLIGIGEVPIDFYRSILPEDALTGRTGIWYHLLFDLKKNWMFGTAYGAYWNVGSVPLALDIEYSYYQLLHTGHSGFIDLCMELGVIPTVLWLIALTVFIIMLRQSMDAISGTLLAFALLHNCLESSFLHGIHFVWVIMLVAMCNMLYTSSQRPAYAVGFRKINAVRRKPIGGAAPEMA